MSDPLAPNGVLGVALGPDALSSVKGAQAFEAAAALARRESPPPAAVAREFEALVLGELTRQATKPLPGTNPLDGGSAARMYREQFFQHVARLSASQGGLGLAAALERQLGGEAPAQATSSTPSIESTSLASPSPLAPGSGEAPDPEGPPEAGAALEDLTR